LFASLGPKGGGGKIAISRKKRKRKRGSLAPLKKR